MRKWIGSIPEKLLIVVLVLLIGSIACSTFLYSGDAAPVDEEPAAEAILIPTATFPAPLQLTETAPPVFIPVTGGGEATPQVVSLDLNTIYAEVIRSLPLGSALFDPIDKMRQGKVYEIEMRISPATEEEIESDEEIKATLTADMETGEAVIIVPVRMSTVMRARLSGPAFSITPLTEEEQIRDSSKPYLQWLWEVRPEERGQQRLTLHLSVVVNAEGMGDKTHTVSEVRQIQVTSNPVYSARVFFGTNWEWIISGLLLPVVGWTWRNIRARRKSQVNK